MQFEYRDKFSLVFRPPFEYQTSEYRTSQSSLQWGSEIWTSLDFEWSKRGWVANGLDFEWDLKSGVKIVGILNGLVLNG